MESLAGKLLIAVPGLSDPNFSRTVVLMVQHDEDGAFGLVLNRPGSEPVAAVWERMTGDPCPVDRPVLIGGPVAGPLMAIHASPVHAEHEIAPGVWFSGHRDHLAALVAEAGEPLLILGGYAGWGPEQLETELAEGSWEVTDATASLVFADSATLWKQALRRVADDRLRTWLAIRTAPAEPWHN